MDAETSLITFDNYFNSYTHFDMGGRVDKAIIACAEKIYKKYKSSKDIKVLRDKYNEMIVNSNLNDTFAYKYQSILCAWSYAQYYDKYMYIQKELSAYKHEAEQKSLSDQKTLNKKQNSFISRFFMSNRGRNAA